MRTCQLAGYNRSNLYYRRKQDGHPALKARMHELAQERPRWGWRRLFIILRLCRKIKVQVWARKKRKVNYVRGALIAPVTAANKRWSLDFMHDRLASGRQFRALTVGDDFTKECLAVEIAHSLGSPDVIRVFEANTFKTRAIEDHPV